MEKGFRQGGMGYGDAKKLLLNQIEKHFGGETREKRRQLDAHPERVEEILVESARKARRTAAATMEKVYAATGLARRSDLK
jgi:tryptophanyl-tRNA synthetase